MAKRTDAFGNEVDDDGSPTAAPRPTHEALPGSDAPAPPHFDHRAAPPQGVQIRNAPGPLGGMDSTVKTIVIVAGVVVVLGIVVFAILFLAVFNEVQEGFDAVDDGIFPGLTTETLPEGFEP